MPYGSERENVRHAGDAARMDRYSPFSWRHTTAEQTADGIVVRIPVQLSEPQYLRAFASLKRLSWTAPDERREWRPVWNADESKVEGSTRWIELVVDSDKQLREWFKETLPLIADGVAKAQPDPGLDIDTSRIDGYEIDKAQGWRER